MDNNEDFMGYVPSVGGSNYEAPPVGVYDFVVHGIVGLGLRKAFFKGVEKDKPNAMVKFIFEIPDLIRDDKQTEVVSVKLPMSTGDRSHFHKLCTVLLGAEAMTEENVTKLCTASGLKTLLGKTGTLTIASWKNDKGEEIRSVDKNGFSPSHPKVTKPIPTREFVFFNPFAPDLDVFKNNLTSWTRKEIMEALNVDQFKPELKALYAQLVAEEQANKDNKPAAKKEEPAIDDSAPWATNEAIQ